MTLAQSPDTSAGQDLVCPKTKKPIGGFAIPALSDLRIFYPLVAPEAYVAKGMIIGYVTDYFGKKLEEAASPLNGVVTYVCSAPSMKKGDTVANIGEIAGEQQPPRVG